MDKFDELRSMTDADCQAVFDNCTTRVEITTDAAASPPAPQAEAAAIGDESLRGQAWAAAHSKTIRLITWAAAGVLVAIYLIKRFI